MATKITAIKEALALLVTNALGGHAYKRIPNPYVIEANSQIILEDGFGVGVGPGEKAEIDLCNIGYVRFFTITFIRRVAATEHDTLSRESIESGMLEDMHTIVKAVESDQTISGNAVRSDYVSDSGINFLVGNDFRYYSLAMTLQITYLENY